ncbi:MAG: family 78 glycoside hydrolase catalytic domain [Pontiellaceae bacterium]|nr:family 78 glycoside hydrolase catalytic domain [Pontiellaceae bacterium]MBN2783670.1 family 78 glycoside hydrolase catalytic domain [Pontiellaceae bacterium]
MKRMFLSMAAMAGLFSGCTAMEGPRDLTVGEGFVNPIGFHDSTPAFSWKLPVGVKEQTACQIMVDRAGEPVWDSGWISSDQSIFVPYAGKPLASRDRLEWKVRFRDQDGTVSDWSKTANFELGLLSKDDWSARWIRPVDAVAEKVSDFELIKAVYQSKAHPEKNRDVTDLLHKKVQGSGFSVRVNNDELGGDPAKDEVKELVVTYLADGTQSTVAVGENRQAVFPAREGDEPACWLRRTFDTAKEIERARVYVTARGLFELYLNGERVGNDWLVPGFTSFDKRIDTLTYDVTSQLKKGNNTLNAMLGKGWYAGRLPFGTERVGHYGKDAELLLQLEIRYADGSSEIIATDRQWEGTWQGPIVSSSIYDCEIFDARKPVEGWGPVLVNDELGPARLMPKPFLAVHKTETMPVQAISEPTPGRYVFDLGQNMVGWARIKLPVEKNRIITIRFAEMLNDDGTLYTTNYRTAKSTDSYVPAKSGVIEWEPRFTFHGFRYVELSGLPAGARPQKSWVEGVVMHSEYRQTGSFESSHAKLNQLQSNITWGWRGNSVDVPTDCPQRDERMGWTGDAQVFCPTAMFNTDSTAFWKSWLANMRLDQEANGTIPEIIPALVHGENSPGWMDAATFVPWEVYVRSGDVEVLKDNFEMMEKLIGWYRAESVDHLLPRIGGFGDWLQPYPQGTGCHGDTPSSLLGAAYYARGAKILADSARILGHDQKAVQYAAESEAVKNAFSTFYFEDSGKIKNAPETQTAYVIALAFDLLPEPQKSRAAKRLVHLVHDAEDHLRTGFLGTPYIVDVLDRAGYPELAAKLLFTETYPSWFYSINQGATTMWERWNSYSHDAGFGDAGMNSFNHYAYGAIGLWMYERLAGLAPDPEQPGYKHLIVSPLVIDQLDMARAKLDTPYGAASSGWVRRNGKVTMEVVVPPNTTATILFPDGRNSETVPAGTYRYQLHR